MIYLDLDETLVLTDPYMCKREGAKSFELEDGKYCCLVRPHARRLIAGCREITETRILTMGTRDYALKINEVHELGFSPDQIITRDDFLNQKFNGWIYMASLSTNAQGVCPDAVLVDNQLPTEQFAELKMHYLGITPERYIEVSTFCCEDYGVFAQEVDKVLCRIKNLKS